jgi:hypothetical protein
MRPWGAGIRCADPELASRIPLRLSTNEICTEIDIDASAEHVWRVLTDFPAYGQWNPVVSEIRGEMKVGGQLVVCVRALGGLPIRFRVRLLRVEPQRELRWRGRLVLSRLFAGEHALIIEPLGDSRVRFVQREAYTGVLARVFLLIMGANNRRIFERMNQALKARAEQAPYKST